MNLSENVENKKFFLIIKKSTDTRKYFRKGRDEIKISVNNNKYGT